MPVGLSTRIGDNGVQLSGEQRQRIGIARAFYYDKQLLIFDEATNALDDLTEKSIMKNIENNKKNNSIVIISHNKETLKICDEIYEILEKKIIKVF